jgi:hypothetical protein
LPISGSAATSAGVHATIPRKPIGHLPEDGYDADIEAKGGQHAGHDAPGQSAAPELGDHGEHAHGENHTDEVNPGIRRLAIRPQSVEGNDAHDKEEGEGPHIDIEPFGVDEADIEKKPGDGQHHAENHQGDKKIYRPIRHAALLFNLRAWRTLG